MTSLPNVLCKVIRFLPFFHVRKVRWRVGCSFSYGANRDFRREQRRIRNVTAGWELPEPNTKLPIIRLLTTVFFKRC